MPFDANDPILVPALTDTGVVADASNLECVMDHAGLPCNPGEANIVLLRRLRTWKARTSDGSFIYIAKAWLDIRGNRRLVMKSHRIRTGGTIGGGVKIINRVNGREIYR